MEELMQAAAGRRAGSCHDKRVTILGAGIAGLVAASELEGAGYAVDIMEGAGRIGGRIWTHRFGEDQDAPYGELGAMRIPAAHEQVLRLIRRLGLGDRLRKFVTLFEEKNALVRLGGVLYRIGDAHQAVCRRNRELGLARRYGERSLLFAGWIHLMVDAISPQALRESLRRDLQVHLLDELERMDLGAFVDQDRQQVDLHGFFAAHPDFSLQLGDALGLFLDDILTETRADLWQLEGGMDRLVQRLCQTLQGPLALNQEVVSLSVADDGVQITWRENGRLYQRHCPQVLCTIPFSIVRDLQLQGFDPDKLAIIAVMEYCKATKVLLHCARPFWRDAGIGGGASFSDEHIRQVYYPSAGGRQSGSVLLGSYTIGSDAAHLDAMSEPERIASVLQGVARLHPEMADPAMLLDARTLAWGSHRWSMGGCSVPWRQTAGQGSSAPGSRAERRYVLEHQKCQALRPQGQLYFAGEHCSAKPAWMEGAIESAIEAAAMIMGRHPANAGHEVQGAAHGGL